MSDLKISANTLQINKYSEHNETKINAGKESGSPKVSHLDELSSYLKTVVHIEESPARKAQVARIAEQVESGAYCINADKIIDQFLAELSY